MNTDSLGTHVTWDVYGCDVNSIAFIAEVKHVLNVLVHELKLSKVNESYKQFEPIGVTGFILLEESHVSIHTWPEHNFAAVDIFSCKPFDNQSIEDILKTTFKSDRVVVKCIQRGEDITILSNQ